MLSGQWVTWTSYHGEYATSGHVFDSHSFFEHSNQLQGVLETADEMGAKVK